ncbi:MAG: tetratricopeptide repeat protein, partial [Pelobacteraceae bacterium]
MATDNRAARLEEYRETSLLADSLARSGKNEETLKLLRECLDKTMAAGDEDYRLFFEAELCGYTTPDLPAQVALLDRALAWRRSEESQPDYFILRGNGVYYSNMGNEKEAIELYDRALAIKPDNCEALRNKGVSLSKLGDMKGAIELYDRALAIKPDDCDALRQKGVSLSIMGDMKGAIELYDRALAIKPDDCDEVRNKGVSLSKMGDEKGAIELYDRALA